MEMVIRFSWTLDLVSQTSLVSSGYACLGPFGGDGVIYKGDPSMIISFGSSLDDNWNYYGYRDTVNSRLRIPLTKSTRNIRSFSTTQFTGLHLILRFSVQAAMVSSHDLRSRFTK